MGGLVVAPTTSPLRPPGVDRLPAAGAMLVSPALRAALADPANAILRARLPYRITGEIGQAGLIGPTDLQFVATDSRIRATGENVSFVTGFGVHESVAQLDSTLALLAAIGVLVLLLPIGVIVTIAGRFGAERRNLRLAALRLLGLSASDTMRLALAEAAIAAILGDLVGLAVFFTARQFLGLFSIATLSVFPSDAVPPLPLAVLVLLIVPALGAGTAMLSLRGVTVEPLGVARRVRSTARRLWWRLLPFLGAAALLVPSIDGFRSTTGGSIPRVGVGVALLLLGALALLPWLTGRLATLLRGGSVSWQFATRRIRHSGSTTSRVVGAVTVALAGAIALQMLFTGLSVRYTDPSESTEAADASTWIGKDEVSGSQAEQFGAAVRSAGGYTVGSTAISARHDTTFAGMVFGSCAFIRRATTATTCANGQTFAIGDDAARQFAGQAVSFTEDSLRWTAPRSIHTVAPRPGGDPTDSINGYTLLVTPGALSMHRLHAGLAVRIAAPAATDSVVAASVSAATAIDPLVQVGRTGSTNVDHRYSSIQRGLSIGLLLVMLLIGGVLLVSIGDQLRERRQMLATLAAVGMPRSVMVRSILWESALPVVLGSVLALCTGVALGGVLLAIVTAGFALDATTTAACVATALAVPLVVTLLSLPAASRNMRPDGLRTE